MARVYVFFPRPEASVDYITTQPQCYGQLGSSTEDGTVGRSNAQVVGRNWTTTRGDLAEKQKSMAGRHRKLALCD